MPRTVAGATGAAYWHAAALADGQGLAEEFKERPWVAEVHLNRLEELGVISRDPAY